MASSVMMSPTASYSSHPPPPPYTHINATAPSAHHLSGLISPPQSHPPESRRTSDDKDPAHGAHRQSLPSIHEALADPKPSGYAPAPSTAISANPYSSYSQPPTPTTRPFSMEQPGYQTTIDRAQPRRPSPPQPVHSYPRAEPAPASYEIPRHPSLPSIRTALPSQATGSAGPRQDLPRHEEQRPVGANGYPHPPSSSAQYNGYPTTSNPASASGFSPESPYHQQRPYPPRYGSDYSKEYPREHLRNGEAGFGGKDDGHDYAPVVKRNLDYWDVEISLRGVVECSSDLLKISSALLAETQRNMHHGSGAERMPSTQDCDRMLQKQETLTDALKRVREMVKQQDMANQHMSIHGGKLPSEYEQDDMGQWTDEGKMGYGGQDSKKRRGRAAPPGRCHSCNRAETPEWRRGPDGARTLCNACGLHYAKLTRKLGSKQAQNAGSSLRKSMDDGSTRS